MRADLMTSDGSLVLGVRGLDVAVRGRGLTGDPVVMESRSGPHGLEVTRLALVSLLRGGAEFWDFLVDSGRGWRAVPVANGLTGVLGELGMLGGGGAGGLRFFVTTRGFLACRVTPLRSTVSVSPLGDGVAVSHQFLPLANPIAAVDSAVLVNQRTGSRVQVPAERIAGSAVSAHLTGATLQEMSGVSEWGLYGLEAVLGLADGERVVVEFGQQGVQGTGDLPGIVGLPEGLDVRFGLSEEGVLRVAVVKPVWVSEAKLARVDTPAPGLEVAILDGNQVHPIGTAWLQAGKLQVSLDMPGNALTDGRPASLYLVDGQGSLGRVRVPLAKTVGCYAVMPMAAQGARFIGLELRNGDAFLLVAARPLSIGADGCLVLGAAGLGVSVRGRGLVGEPLVLESRVGARGLQVAGVALASLLNGGAEFWDFLVDSGRGWRPVRVADGLTGVLGEVGVLGEGLAGGLRLFVTTRGFLACRVAPLRSTVSVSQIGDSVTIVLGFLSLVNPIVAVDLAELVNMRTGRHTQVPAEAIEGSAVSVQLHGDTLRGMAKVPEWGPCGIRAVLILADGARVYVEFGQYGGLSAVTFPEMVALSEGLNVSLGLAKNGELRVAVVRAIWISDATLTSIDTPAPGLEASVLHGDQIRTIGTILLDERSLVLGLNISAQDCVALPREPVLLLSVLADKTVQVYSSPESLRYVTGSYQIATGTEQSTWRLKQRAGQVLLDCQTREMLTDGLSGRLVAGSQVDIEVSLPADAGVRGFIIRSRTNSARSVSAESAVTGFSRVAVASLSQVLAAVWDRVSIHDLFIRLDDGADKRIRWTGQLPCAVTGPDATGEVRTVSPYVTASGHLSVRVTRPQRQLDVTFDDGSDLLRLQQRIGTDWCDQRSLVAVDSRGCCSPGLVSATMVGQTGVRLDVSQYARGDHNFLTVELPAGWISQFATTDQFDIFRIELAVRFWDNRIGRVFLGDWRTVEAHASTYRVVHDIRLGDSGLFLGLTYDVDTLRFVITRHVAVRRISLKVAGKRSSDRTLCLGDGPRQLLCLPCERIEARIRVWMPRTTGLRPGENSDQPMLVHADGMVATVVPMQDDSGPAWMGWVLAGHPIRVSYDMVDSALRLRLHAWYRESRRLSLAGRLWLHFRTWWLSRRQVPTWLLGENLGRSSENIEELYRFMEKQQRVRWLLVTSPEQRARIRRECGSTRHVAVYDSYRHLAYAQTATAFVVTHGYRDVQPSPMRGVEVKPAQLYYLQHGVIAMKKIGIDGAYFGGHLARFFVSSAREGELARRYLHLTRKQTAVTGLARWDRPTRGRRRGRSIFIMLTWRDSMVRDPSTVRDNPTYRIIQRLIEDAEVLDYLSRSCVQLILGMHVEMARFDVFSVKDERVVVLPPSHAIGDSLSRCSALITDYSSAAFDALQHGAAVLFIQPDRQSFLGERGAYVDLDTDLPGPVVTTYQDLVTELRELVEGEFHISAEWCTKREPWLCPVEHGSHCQAIFDEIMSDQGSPRAQMSDQGSPRAQSA